MHITQIIIDSTQLKTNLRAIREYLNRIKPDTLLCYPIKANAYGHGLLGVAQLTQELVDYFAVACVDEGEKLRMAGITKPILVFGAFNSDQIAGMITNNLELTISSVFKARQVLEYCSKHQVTAKIHLKVDTGMNRVGVRVETLPELLEFVFSYNSFKVIGVYSHLATADEEQFYTQIQIDKFKKVVQLAKKYDPNIICHLANSAGLCYFNDTLFDMVRPGILSYGYFPNIAITEYPLNQIKPCFSLKSRVNYLKVVDKDQGISYNRKYITKAKTKIATIPIGYGDGYRRMLSNIGQVLINGHKYTIAGMICMDMFMVDIGIDSTININDEVILIGKQGNYEITLTDISLQCQTNIYEILCGFNDRIPRLYI